MIYYFSILYFSFQYSLNSQNCFISIDRLTSDLLSEKTDLTIYKPCYNIKKIQVEDPENSNIRWVKYEFYRDDNISFVAETNWENNDLIERVTVFDSNIKYVENVFVGQSFKYFKQDVKEVYWDESFGTFYVYISNNKNIAVELRTTSNSNLLKWENNINYIPDDTKVKSIIIIK